MRLVTIAKFSYVHEAQVVKSLLESEGIQAFIANENIATQDWLYTNAVGGVRVEVPEKDADAAQELLAHTYTHEEMQKVFDDSEEGSAPNTDTCPKCGSGDIKYEVTRKPGILLSWFLLGSPVFPLGKRLRCEKCGATWKP